MDNSAKALQIAGTVLIAIMIISLVVFAYRKISDLKQTEEDVLYREQISDFNRKLEIYNKNQLYGSEILSLANELVDYERREHFDKGYENIELIVHINNHTEYTEFTAGNYGKEELIAAYERLSGTISTRGNTIMGRFDTGDGTTKSITYREASLLPSRQLERITVTHNPSIINPRDNLRENYTNYLDEQSGFARLRFTTVRYDYETGRTGRITRMEFREI